MREAGVACAINPDGADCREAGVADAGVADPIEVDCVAGDAATDDEEDGTLLGGGGMRRVTKCPVRSHSSLAYSHETHVYIIRSRRP